MNGRNLTRGLGTGLQPVTPGFDLSNFNLCIVSSFLLFLIYLSLLVGRRASKRARALTPPSRQSTISAGPVIIVAASKPAQTGVTPQIPALHSPSHQAATPLAEILAYTVFYLVDESEHGADKEAPLKRQIIEVDGRVVEEGVNLS